MAKAEIHAGACGFVTNVEAEADGMRRVTLRIESQCKAIQRLAEHLPEVDALNEITFRGDMPETLVQGAAFCSHAACPVPVGIIKVVEVAAGLALPREVSIKLSKD